MKNFRVRLTAQAESDLIDIWLAIAGDSPFNADRFLDRLNRRIDSLVNHPGRGAPRPEIGKDVRILIEGNFLIVYRVTAEEAEIVRVVHGARDLDDLFGD